MSEVGDETEVGRLKTILADIAIYADDVLKISRSIKGDSMLRDNMHAYASAQGAIDVVLDLKTLLDGGKIASLDEIKKAVEKERSEAVIKQGTPYNY